MGYKKVSYHGTYCDCRGCKNRRNRAEQKVNEARSWEVQDRTDTHTTRVNGGHSYDLGVGTTEFLITPRDGSPGDHVVLSAEDGTEIYHGEHHNR
jgi:hypothetical protein